MTTTTPQLHELMIGDHPELEAAATKVIKAHLQAQTATSEADKTLIGSITNNGGKLPAYLSQHLNKDGDLEKAQREFLHLAHEEFPGMKSKYSTPWTKPDSFREAIFESTLNDYITHVADKKSIPFINGMPENFLERENGAAIIR